MRPTGKENIPWSLNVTSDPGTEPLSTSEAKKHLHVTISSDDTYIDSLVLAAREYAEGVTNRAFINRTIELTLDDFPLSDTIFLPKPPLNSVTKIEYTDEGGTTATVSSDDYHVDTSHEPGRIVLADAATWPSDDLQEGGGVVITYVAGYGASGSDVPENFRLAMRQMVGIWYEEGRKPVAINQNVIDIPFSVRALLGVKRIFSFG